MESVDKLLQEDSHFQGLKNGLNLRLNIKTAKEQSQFAYSPALPLTLDLATGKAIKKDRNLDKPLQNLFEKSLFNSFCEKEASKECNQQQFVRRSSIICSSGKDKYTFDSETVAMPLRPIEVYEKQLSLQSTSSTTSSASGGINRTIIKMSSFTEDSDRNFSQDNTSKDLNSLENFPLTLKLKCNRKSIVQSAQIKPPKSLMVNGRFQNPWNTWSPVRFSNILKLGLSKDKSNLPKKEQLDVVLPTVKPNLESTSPSDGVRVIWIGHSTVLVQFDNITIITDPNFSERASPSQVIGPKRYRSVPCSIDELPSTLDAVVISHNHYDHLDLNTVTHLNNRYGADLRWFIPLGLGEWFVKAGVDNYIELDWWEENFVPDKTDISFVFTPAQHWSKRTLNDNNKSLWGSWTIIGPRFRFFFAGDTGFCSVFEDIGKMFGPFTVCAIPIGSFEPKWFQKHSHIDPEEAVIIHQHLKSNFSLAIHWGTFALTNEYYLDPPMKLREALEKKDLPFDCFTTFKHGETRIVKSDGTSIVEKAGSKYLH